MATVTTTTTTSLISPTQSKIERCQDGTLIAGVRRANGNLGFFYSKNNGTSWIDMGTGSDVVGLTNALEYAFFVDQGSYITCVWRSFTSGKDTLHFRYGAPNNGSNVTAWNWFTDVTVATVFATTATTAGGSWQGLDVITVANPAGGSAAALAIITAGAGTDFTGISANDGFVCWAITMTTGGAYLDKTNAWIAGSVRPGDFRNQFAFGASCWPSLDFKNTGDGKRTSGTLDITVVFNYGDGNIYGKERLVWNGNGFTSAFSYVYCGSSYGQPTNPSQARRQCRIDGSGRLLIPQITGNDTMVVVQFDASQTTRTNIFALPHPKGTVTAAALTYDSAGNIYLFAVGTTDNTLYSSTYARNSATWTAWAVVNATVMTALTGFSVRRGAQGSRVDSLTQTGTPTFTITNVDTLITGNPFAPTWNGPPNNSAQNVSAALLLDWNFSDPDVTDTQGSYAVSRQIGAGALAYWRASDSTWQAAEVQNTSTVDQLSLASGWAVATDANYTFKAKVWDASGLPSPYSTGLVITPSALVNPTVTAPAAAAVIASTSTTVTWTVAEQTAYQLIVEKNVSGVFTTIFNQSGTTATSRVVTGLENGQAYRLTLITKNNEGLASTPVQVNFTVTFTPPPTPTVTFPVMTYPYLYVVGITINNPAGSPAPNSNNIERRIGTDDTTIVTVATGVAVNGTYYDATVSSGVSYQYRATAVTSAGATAVGAWTA